MSISIAIELSDAQVKKLQQIAEETDGGKVLDPNGFAEYVIRQMVDYADNVLMNEFLDNGCNSLAGDAFPKEDLVGLYEASDWD